MKVIILFNYQDDEYYILRFKEKPKKPTQTKM